MRFGNSVSIDHSTLLAPSFHTTGNGRGMARASEGDFGTIVLQTWQLPAITITSINGHFRKNLHVRHHDENECLTVNSCYALKGKVVSRFAGLREALTLTDGSHNFIYKTEVMDEHFLTAEGKEFAMVHVAIDRSRYLNLLSFDEIWCKELRSRIDSKQMIFGKEYPLNISCAMYRTLDDIVNCPLTGSLGTILLEAKVLELIVYQLHQYYRFNFSQQMPMSKSDRDIFFEIKAYLAGAYEKEHSLRSLARQFGINEFKLKKGFREMFGTTVFGYIHTMKMQHARAMMEEAGLTVSEAASRTGYKNPNHFSAAFKKQFGLSPSLLRRSNILV